MKILVTGAAGFIGSHMCEALVSSGHKVIGLDSMSDYYNVKQKEINVDGIIKAGVDFIEKDLSRDDILPFLSEIDVVFHFAAQPGISANVSFDSYEKNNILATYRLLESIKSISTLKLFINISTSSVYGISATSDENGETKPASYYGVTKLAAEQLSLSYYRSYNLPVTSFRLFSVYGERERPDKLYPKLISSIILDKSFDLYKGSDKHIRSYTYVGDIVQGLILSLDNIDKCVGQIFNLGTNEPATTGDAISIVEEILSKKAIINVIPKRSGDQNETSANIEKIKKIIGYEPKTSLKEGLKKEVEWVKEVLNKGLLI